MIPPWAGWGGEHSLLLGAHFLPWNTCTRKPCSGRRPKMSALLFNLLLHPLMQREASEILLSHGSKRAWQVRRVTGLDNIRDGYIFIIALQVPVAHTVGLILIWPLGLTSALELSLRPSHAHHIHHIHLHPHLSSPALASHLHPPPSLSLHSLDARQRERCRGCDGRAFQQALWDWC